jgi:aryl sulfotransferase
MFHCNTCDTDWPPLERPKGDIVQYFHEWLNGGGLPLGFTFWEHIHGWWEARRLPNLLLVHLNHLKADLPGEMRRIAGFLGIEIDEAQWRVMVEHCAFEHMKAESAKVPELEKLFNGGGNTLFNKGTNGRWRDVLSAADVQKYERIANDYLTPECARWVATGEMAT